MKNRPEGKRAAKTKKASIPAVSKTNVTKLDQKSSKREFKASFRDRAVFSFSRCIESLSDGWGDYGQEDKLFVGLSVGNAYKYLGHCIEMLSKASLERVSPLLVLENLKHMDELGVDDLKVGQALACVGLVSLARSSKIFKYPLSMNDRFILKEIVDTRNQFEHRDFSIRSIKGSQHFIVRAAGVVVKIYDRQFKSANLVKECGVETDYKKFCTEISVDFKDVEKLRSQRKKSGNTFSQCRSCLYEFAELNHSQSQYKCLWCGDERKIVQCDNPSCMQKYWAKVNDSSAKCPSPHLVLELPTSFNPWQSFGKVSPTLSLPAAWDSETERILGEFRNSLSGWENIFNKGQEKK